MQAPAEEPRLVAAREARLIAVGESRRVVLLQILAACQPVQEVSSSDGSGRMVPGAHQARTQFDHLLISRRCVRVPMRGVLTGVLAWRERLCPFHQQSLTAALGLRESRLLKGKTWGKISDYLKACRSASDSRESLD